MTQEQKRKIKRFYDLYCLKGKLEARSAKGYLATKKLIEFLQKKLNTKFTDEDFCAALKKFIDRK
ncbi:hypothetical protein ES703_23503 [subsurface metagenome]